MDDRQLGYMEGGAFHPLTQAKVIEDREFGEALNLRVRVMRYDLDFARDPVGVVEAVIYSARRDLIAAAMRRPTAAGY